MDYRYANHPSSAEDVQLQDYQRGQQNYGYDDVEVLSDFHVERETDISPEEQQYANGPAARRDSNASTESYVSTADEIDEVEEREFLAANLGDPNYIIDLLPSRTLGRGIIKTTSSSKWVKPTTVRRRKGQEGAVEEHSDEENEIVKKIMEDTKVVDGSKAAAVKRRNTIRGMSSNMETKKAVRRKVAKKSKKKAKTTSPIKAAWYSLSYSMGSLKERIVDWLKGLALWTSSIKTIEGNFGSSVTSFFILLRWLLFLNIIVFLLTFSLIVIPELFYRYPDNRPVHQDFSALDLLTGGGWLANSTLFYGSYTNQAKYNIPLAYLLVYSVCYILILVVLIKSISSAYRQFFVTGDQTHGFYSSKVFTGWDFGVTSEVAAKLNRKSIYLELAENLSGKVKREGVSKFQTCKLYLIRIFTNLIVFAIIAAACILIVAIYNGSVNTNVGEFLSELAVPLLVAGYNLILPYMFTVITNLERYKNPRNALYVALGRVFLMKVVVLVTLIVFWLQQVENCDVDSCECWETFAGQEIYKLVIIDFLVQFVATGLGELIFAIMRKFCFKGLTSPEFNIARNTMDLIQSQAYTWIGMYFSPLLMAFCIIKIIITFYVKRTSVLYNCTPSNQAWRASLTKTVFLIILFVFFAICGFSVGYIIVQSIPSDNCGPFRGLENPFEVLLDQVQGWNDIITTIFSILTSPGFILAVIIVLILAIYYFRTVTKGRRKIIKRLKQQIILEGQDKRFLLKRLRAVVGNLTANTKDNVRHRRLAEQDRTKTEGNKPHNHKYVQSKDGNGGRNQQTNNQQHLNYPGAPVVVNH
ncbi:transmembrane channel-like protein 5 [Apostichopus japonicus]|uniref:transmembrane channel-like protein 5 n=1 Tax=Stichopus japonicus TaxID=307972 RepID=UPI003AB6320E